MPRTCIALYGCVSPVVMTTHKCRSGTWNPDSATRLGLLILSLSFLFGLLSFLSPFLSLFPSFTLLSFHSPLLFSRYKSRYSTVHYCTLQNSTIRYCTVRCSTGAHLFRSVLDPFNSPSLFSRYRSRYSTVHYDTVLYGNGAAQALTFSGVFLIPDPTCRAP